MYLPALGEALDVTTQEPADYEGLKVDGHFRPTRTMTTCTQDSSTREWRNYTYSVVACCQGCRVNTTVIVLYSPVVSVVAGSPTLEESNLDKTEGPRPTDRSVDKG